MVYSGNLKLPPGLSRQMFLPAPKRTAPSGSGRLAADAMLLASLEKSASGGTMKVRETGMVTKIITRADYGRLAELALAGRSDSEIARRFGVPVQTIVGHIARALREYRERKLRVRPDQVIEEARKTGAERAQIGMGQGVDGQCCAGQQQHVDMMA